MEEIPVYLNNHNPYKISNTASSLSIMGGAIKSSAHGH